ncbi:MAG: dinitrogenase iron-molybdenum cofactor [Promethearchaeota archaeon Loki_b32]|nr:MAG: dinitrogenase iron-molybdenum cofactor [Candidatus Lokiarchaeota archaeon Loki_b32]
MKIAISTESGNVCAHFGRAPEFTFVTIEDNQVLKKEVLQNPGHSVGSIPQFVNQQGAKYMIAGGMGHRAEAFFSQYGIEVIVGISGKIDDVIKKILDGTLERGESLCTPGGGKGYGVEKIHTEADDNHEHHHHE